MTLLLTPGGEDGPCDSDEESSSKTHYRSNAANRGHLEASRSGVPADSCGGPLRGKPAILVSIAGVQAYQLDALDASDDLYFDGVSQISRGAHTEVHQQFGRFTMRGDRTPFLFTFADPDPTRATFAPKRPSCGNVSERAAGNVRAWRFHRQQ